MNISVSYAMTPAEAATAVHGLKKFEVMRVIPGYVVGIIGIGVCLAVHSSVAAEICAFVVLVVAGLTVRWLRIVAHVRRTAAASTLATSVSIADDGLTVSRQDSAATAHRWHDVIHCTNTAHTWIFAFKGGRDALLIPHKAIDPKQRSQVAGLLATWPKRRFRTAPW